MPALNLDLLTIGISIAAILTLGFVVFFQNRKSATNILFLSFSLVCSGWSAINYLSYQVSDPQMSLWIVRSVMFFAVLQVSLFLLLTFTFPSDVFRLSRFVKYIYIPVTIFILGLTLSPFLFSSVEITSGSAPSPVPAPGIAFFALYSVLSVVSGLIILLKRLVSSVGKERQQYLSILLGVLTMFALIIIFNFVAVAVFNNSSFIPLSGLFVLPFVLFIFNAIVRHQLLNVRILGTEILVFMLVILTLFEVILSVTFVEIIFRIVIFVVLLVLSIFFIRSVVRESQQRQELQTLTEKLKALDKQKDEFISIAAHELRAPLTAIKGYSSMILDGDAGKVPEKALEFLGDVNLSTERMVRLIGNLLNVGRIEENRLVYQMGEIKLSDVANTVYKEFSQEAKLKNLELKNNASEGVKDLVYVDKDRIHEVIGNFVGNGIKYTETGAVTVTLTNPNPDIVRLEVTDTGAGISPDDQKKLFQKYFRAKASAAAISGTGLGLYVSRLLIEKFNGRIGVNSEEGKGSTFWFELPLVASTPKEPAA